MKNWILFFALILFSKAALQAQVVAGCFDQQGKPVGCGESFIAIKEDGSRWNCTCNCGGTSPYECVPLDNGNSYSNTNSGPTQEELTAYYNQQWTDQLSQQADIDFRKGMEAMKAGNCEKAARHFNMARKMVSLKIYEDSYNAAIACKNGTQAQQNKPNPTNNQPPVIPQKPANSGNPTSSGNPRDRGQGTPSTSTSPSTQDMVVKKNIMMEQKSMEANPETWVAYQKRQFALRIQQPDYWCKNYVNQLQQQIDSAKKNEAWNPMKPKTTKDLKPGDVILVEGTGVSGNIIQGVDMLFTGSTATNASHTLTYLKEVDGVKLFLDNTPSVGAVIISEQQMREKYDGRGTEIARMTGAPLDSAEVKLLWNKAIEMQQKNNQEALFSYNLNGEKKFIAGTEWGIVGDDMLCSEASWELIKATGRKDFNPESKGWINGLFKKNVIGFSPADFYENNQYFLISTLDLTH